MTKPRPWPESATGERDRASYLLHILLLEIRHLKKLSRSGMEPNALKAIATDLFDYGSEGYRLLERESWSFRWPDNAKEARDKSIDAFYDSMHNGRVIRQLLKNSTINVKYLQDEIADKATDLVFCTNEAITKMVSVGAKRYSIDEET